jgi:hypothetical protein
MKLHIGAGTDPQDGWTNLDLQDGEGVDIVANLDTDTLPIEDDSVTELLGIHVVEHLHNPLHAMNELWRVAEPGAMLTVATPYGTSDDAWEDPTHVRPYFVNSWAPFSQPYHWRSSGYGYVADWQPVQVVLQLRRDEYAGVPAEQAMRDIKHSRNVVVQMVATLKAVKPARARDKALLTPPDFRLQLVDAD